MSNSEEINRLLSELREQMNSLTDAKREVDAEIRAEHRKLNELQSRELLFRNSLAELRGKLRDTESNLLKVQQEEKVAEENRKIADEYKRKIAEIYYIILQYSWFEKAKAHQIDGARKLAVAKKAVLGDERVLGKTLTSIAACDLVGSRKILAIVPNDVMGNFKREVNYWASHRSVHIIGGTTR